MVDVIDIALIVVIIVCVVWQYAWYRKREKAFQRLAGAQERQISALQEQAKTYEAAFKDLAPSAPRNLMRLDGGDAYTVITFQGRERSDIDVFADDDVVDF